MSTPDRDSRSDRPRFRETALASGLLEEQQVGAAEHEVGTVMDRRVADPEAWDRAVADLLVSQRLLTPFQAREMLAGRKRFRLGQYTVLDEIGRGGMGQVFRAEHAMMGRDVAVKVLPRAKSTPEAEAAFRREMRMLGRLDHENLVRAFDAGYDAMVSYLVTELVPGMDLKRYVHKHGPLDEAAAASVIAQAARGLAYAHAQGLVHRDVKPGNLLVMQDGRVKVLDLGLAGSQLEEEASRIGRVVGTMDYIAPEQIRAPDDVGPSADVYALGCTLYYAVTGRVPFPGGSRKDKMHRHLAEQPEPARNLAPHLSEAFGRVVDDMMAKDPARRIPSAAAVVERLRPWLPDGLTWNGRGLAVAEAGGGLSDPISPPPLPQWGGASDRSWGSSAFGVSESSTGVVVDGAGRLAAAITRRVPSRRLVAQSLAVAACVGLAFGWVVGLVRRIDPDEFANLLGAVTPAMLGMGAFLVFFVLCLMSGTRSRRRW
ncbi:MAG: serine/threonine-protein kinase [Planctomycetaceae bacterium]